jgi:hypothetical protein
LRDARRGPQRGRGGHHAICGAVGAALKGKEQPPDNLKQLVGLIYTGDDLPKDKEAALDAAIRNNV